MSEMIAIAAFKIQSPIEAPFRALARWYQARKTVAILRKLSADQLADIGLDYQSLRRIH